MNDLLARIESEIPRLRRYARTLARNPDDADDLVQGCLMRAVANLHSFEPGTNLPAWLFTILRNGHITEMRRRSRIGEPVALDEDDGRFGVTADQETQLYLADVAVAFQCLAPDHREVLQLVAIEGLSYEEAAAILGVPLGTVRSRLSRARTALKTLLEVEPRDRWRPAA